MNLRALQCMPVAIHGLMHAGVALMLGAVTLPATALDASLASPAGGWNRAGLTDRSQEETVAYPYSPIDRGAQKNRTLIEGRIAEAGKQRMPHKLIVNGNPMPLYTDKDGRFRRPYVFGPGSNSIEIKTPDGKPVKRIQFYEANGNRSRATIRVICTWDDDQAEVDLHVVTPDGQHAYFAHPLLTNGGGLDVDSVDGAGPEMFSMTAPLRGTYHVFVNYWGNFGDSGYHFDEGTRKKDVITTRITLVFHENTAREKRETLIVPLRRIGDLTLARTFVF